jgi:transposase-like protein
MGEEHRQTPQRTRRGFTKEFKRDAVELVRSTGRPIAEIARELGIYDSTLGNWVRQDRRLEGAVVCVASGTIPATLVRLADSGVLVSAVRIRLL